MVSQHPAKVPPSQKGRVGSSLTISAIYGAKVLRRGILVLHTRELG